MRKKMFSKGQKIRVRETIEYNITNYIFDMLVEDSNRSYFIEKMRRDEITVVLDKCYDDEWEIQEVIIDESRYNPSVRDAIYDKFNTQCGRKISMDEVRRFMRNRKVSCQVLDSGGVWKDCIDYLWERGENLLMNEKMVDLVSEMV